MKARLRFSSGIAVAVIQFVSWFSHSVQAQDIQITTPSRRSVSDELTLPDGLSPRVAVLPDTFTVRTAVENGEVLEITALEDIAMTNNPTIAQAARRVQALQGKHTQVGLRPNPVIGYQAEEMGDEGTAGQHGMFIGQRIVTGGKLGLNRAIVSHEVEQARQELEMQRLRVFNAVRGRAYETIVAQRAVSLNQQLVAIGQAGVKAAQELRAGKEVGQVDVLQARVEANSATLGLTNAQNEHLAAWRRLAIVMGVPDMIITPLADDLGDTVSDFSWDDMVSQLLGESPELARAWAGVQRAKYALARAQAGRTPDIDLEAAVRHNSATDNTTASIGIGVPLQIFDRNQGNIRTAQAELAAAHREVRRVELVLQDQLAVVFKQYANARQQTAQYTSAIIPDAESSLDLVRTGYQEGEFTYLDLLTTQRTYFRVNLAYLESLRQLWLSSVEIEGLLLTGGLAQPGT